ncbi:histidine kinase N-terminal 7TM domain-containing diguanylate cyclase [Salipaludibacillus agaradhaerens]|uniref:histidine kinase N-terminal 7TM domain-containing diguanylate cyclase n=1 Tax=Salipaludibacillus agaradhaerens TaxID=76935 RepID=UPI000995F55B|nr:diguanylate cyclase [Salipaludibacillus agaradhaerens]
MHWTDIYPYYLLLMGFFSFMLAILTLRYPRTPGRFYFASLLFLSFLLVTLTAAELYHSSYTVMLWLRNSQQIPIFLSAILLLALVRSYLGKPEKTTARIVIVLSLPVIVYFSLIITDHHHHIMRTWVDITQIGSLTEINVNPTFINLMFIAYYQFVAMSAVVVLLLNIRMFSEKLRRKFVFMFTGISIPVWLPALSMALPFKIPGTMSISYTLAGLFVFIAFFRYQIMSVWPIAKDRIFEQMSDGIVLSDSYNRIVDINPAGEKVLHLINPDKTTHSWIGEYLPALLESYPSLINNYINNKDLADEIEIVEESKKIFYLVRFHPIRHSGKEEEAILTIFTDVTTKKMFENELLEKATTDYLTGLHNRRHFVDSFERFNIVKGRCNTKVALLLLDIDDFKIINDTYGHQTGDDVLVVFSERLRDFFSNGAAIGRIGGEEFAVCLIDKDDDEIINLARRFRDHLVNTPLHLKGHEALPVRVSIGMATAYKGSKTFEWMHKAADEALYKAKNSGKNQVIPYLEKETVHQ